MIDDPEWELFRSFSDLGPAEVLKGKLETGGVPARLQPMTLESGVDGEFSVFVPRPLAHRARWLVNQLPMSDTELEYLATGHLPGDKS